MDIFAVIGMFLGITFILTGQAMEGGNIGQLLQITAAFIVLGGTCGAVVLSFPPKILISAIKILKDVFMPPKADFEALITEIGSFATKARKEGIIALEKEANNAHCNIGKDIREVIKKNGGTMPEDLPTPKKSLKQLEKENKKSLKK